MRVARAVVALTEAFERLPGIGPKTAQRLTYYLLHVPQTQLEMFAGALTNLKKNTVECEECHNIAETQPCDICSDGSRDKSIVCVVEQPLDVMAMERSGKYKGVYHVLHGVIDPLHNIGPDEIRIESLAQRCKGTEAQEVILALNPNMEGEATGLYIKRLVGERVKITRLARGLATGVEIEYADDTTLARALEGRQEV
jgi:recombination protein RecR